jgi:predicted PurR-regulated permease PerM
MLFQEYIEQIQKKPVQDRKVIALIVTSILFVCFTGILFKLGGFAISTRPAADEKVQNSVNDLSKQTSGFFDQTKGQFNEFSSSTKAINDQLQTMNSLLASSTASSTLGNTSSTTTVQN